MAGLVDGDGQHPRVVPEDPLDAVAVVDVDVDVRHALDAGVEQGLDADGDVVVDAEAAGAVGHRVVQPAGDAHRVQALAAGHLSAGLDGGADDVRRRLVHPLEDRVVGACRDRGRGSRRRAGPVRCRPWSPPRPGRAPWTLTSCSIVANGASTSRSRSPVTPSSAASRIVRSTRSGDMGWVGPKSYAVREGSKTAVAGPSHSAMSRRLALLGGRASVEPQWSSLVETVSHWACARTADPPVVARLTADPRSSTPTSTHGRLRAAVVLPAPSPGRTTPPDGGSDHRSTT